MTDAGWSGGHLSPDSQWAVYEANVQAYRGLSLSSQSLFLTVGALFVGFDQRVPFFAVLALSQLSMWWIWFPVIFARTAIVDFHKFNLGARFDAEGVPMAERTLDDTESLDERRYAAVFGGRALRRRIRGYLSRPGQEPFRTLRTSRRKIDLVLPVMLSATWVTFAVHVVLTY